MERRACGAAGDKSRWVTRLALSSGFLAAPAGALAGWAVPATLESWSEKNPDPPDRSWRNEQEFLACLGRSKEVRSRINLAGQKAGRSRS